MVVGGCGRLRAVVCVGVFVGYRCGWAEGGDACVCVCVWLRACGGGCACVRVCVWGCVWGCACVHVLSCTYELRAPTARDSPKLELP